MISIFNQALFAGKAQPRSTSLLSNRLTSNQATSIPPSSPDRFVRQTPTVQFSGSSTEGSPFEHVEAFIQGLRQEAADRHSPHHYQFYTEKPIEPIVARLNKLNAALESVSGDLPKTEILRREFNALECIAVGFNKMFNPGVFYVADKAEAVRWQILQEIVAHYQTLPPQARPRSMQTMLDVYHKLSKNNLDSNGKKSALDLLSSPFRDFHEEPSPTPKEEARVEALHTLQWWYATVTDQNTPYREAALTVLKPAVIQNLKNYLDVAGTEHPEMDRLLAHFINAPNATENLEACQVLMHMGGAVFRKTDSLDTDWPRQTATFVRADYLNRIIPAKLEEMIERGNPTARSALPILLEAQTDANLACLNYWIDRMQAHPERLLREWQKVTDALETVRKQGGGNKAVEPLLQLVQVIQHPDISESDKPHYQRQLLYELGQLIGTGSNKAVEAAENTILPKIIPEEDIATIEPAQRDAYEERLKDAGLSLASFSTGLIGGVNRNVPEAVNVLPALHETQDSILAGCIELALRRHKDAEPEQKDTALEKLMSALQSAQAGISGSAFVSPKAIKACMQVIHWVNETQPAERNSLYQQVSKGLNALLRRGANIYCDAEEVEWLREAVNHYWEGIHSPEVDFLRAQTNPLEQFLYITNHQRAFPSLITLLEDNQAPPATRLEAAYILFRNSRADNFYSAKAREALAENQGQVDADALDVLNIYSQNPSQVPASFQEPIRDILSLSRHRSVLEGVFQIGKSSEYNTAQRLAALKGLETVNEENTSRSTSRKISELQKTFTQSPDDELFLEFMLHQTHQQMRANQPLSIKNPAIQKRLEPLLLRTIDQAVAEHAPHLLHRAGLGGTQAIPKKLQEVAANASPALREEILSVLHTLWWDRDCPGAYQAYSAVEQLHN